MPTREAEIRTRFVSLINEFIAETAKSLSPDEKKWLQNLRENLDAPEIFAMVEDSGRTKRLFHLYLEASNLFRTFNVRIEQAYKMLTDLKNVGQAVAIIEQFLEMVQIPARDRLAAYVHPDLVRISIERQAMSSIGYRIDEQKRIASETILRLGATRKRQGNPAAKTATIGWVAEGIKRITGRANKKLCADFSQLILGGIVTDDTINNAAKTRKREWRLPL